MENIKRSMSRPSMLNPKPKGTTGIVPDYRGATDIAMSRKPPPVYSNDTPPLYSNDTPLGIKYAN